MLPEVDISPFTDPLSHKTDERATTAAAWGAAMETMGFAFVSGHGVDERTVSELRAAALEFFAQPMTAKMRHTHGPYGNTNGGYTAQGTESVGNTRGGSATQPDLVESYVILEGGDPALHPTELWDTGFRYHQALRGVMDALNACSAVALGLEPGFFNPFFTNPSCALRLAHYPPIPSDVADGQLRYAAHTDYQGFTILLQDELDAPGPGGGGLEVLKADNSDAQGEWIAVPPRPGCFLVNIGDLYEVWTNARWKSTVHRVSNPPKDSAAAKRNRLSIPFFTGPNDDALIAPLQTCVNEGEDPLFLPVRSLDHLLTKIRASNV